MNGRTAVAHAVRTERVKGGGLSNNAHHPIGTFANDILHLIFTSHIALEIPELQDLADRVLLGRYSQSNLAWLGGLLGRGTMWGRLVMGRRHGNERRVWKRLCLMWS